MDDVDRGNAEQAAEWNGPAGAHRTKLAARFDAQLLRYHERLRAASAVEATDRVVDIGCGTGQTTRDAARAAGSGSVLGVDLSAQMLDLARRISAQEGLRNVSYEQADAQTHPFPAGEFDLAISRFGTMFFADPVAAFTNIGRTLRPAGRLVMLVWQGLEHQEWSLTIRSARAPDRPLPVPTGPDRFTLADPDTATAILDAAGFIDVGFDDLREPLHYGPDVDSAWELVVGMRSTRELLAGLDAEQTARALDHLRASLVAHDTGDGVWFDARAWIITARRR